eukprot:scaffold8136_cov127-Cylindrotheca_fusiformis.AAC.13
MSSSHIRPRIRKSAGGQKNNNNKKTVQAASAAAPVQELEQRMEAWMGLNSSPPSTEAGASNADATSKKPSGILKTPKYSFSSITTTTMANESLTQRTTIEQTGTDIGEEEEDTNTTSPMENVSDSIQGQAAAPAVICERFVIERDPYHRPNKSKNKNRQKETQTAQGSHAAVEGYETKTALSPSSPLVTFSKNPGPRPTTTTDSSTRQSEEDINSSSSPQTEQLPNVGSAVAQGTKKNVDAKDDESPMIVLNSLEELFEAAGQELPKDRSTITPDTKLVEADMAFSVMTQEQYGEKMTQMKRELEAEREDVYKMFRGTENIFGDDDEIGSSSQAESDGDSDGEDEDDEEFLEFLMEHGEGDDYDDDGEAEVAPPPLPRAFTLIWTALAEWLTPEAVEWMARLEHPEKSSSSSNEPLYRNGWTPQVDRSDIGASRCAGLMAMIKMYLPSSMDAMNHPADMRRTAEHRIGDFLRTFDYSSEAPKLPTKMWKTITCILLDMVLIETRAKTVDSVPPSVEAVGMTIEEYKYLTRKAVQTFQP